MVLLTLVGALLSSAIAHSKTTPDSPVHITDQLTLQYKAYPNGDRIPDYSYCGYMASEAAIPHVGVQVIVPVQTGDATRVIQEAINYVSQLPVRPDGFRGAVLLEPGTYTIEGTLYLRASGVVLRGSGTGENGTKLIAAGDDNKGALIRIVGGNNQIVSKYTPLADEYVPVNAQTLNFAAPHSFKIGDQVIVNRPSTAEWLALLGTDRLGNQMEYNLVKWTPGDFDIFWDRTVTAVTPNSITLDVPLTNSLDPKYGGGQVAKYTWNDRINNVGVENLSCVSEYDESNPKDENHRWQAVTIDNAEDCWVRRLDIYHFAGSCVAVWESARRITVEDCRSYAPVSEIANYRRFSFQTMGQQTLFQRCYAEYGYHDFLVGWTTPGPNAFVQCTSYMPYNFSGTFGGWSNGVLFDKATVIGGSLSYDYRDMSSQGAGWTTANSMFWQCRAGQMHVRKVPGAQNWNYGAWTQPYGDGHYECSHTYLQPESFFYAQLEARLGKPSPEADKIYVYESDETTAPTPEYAHQMSLQSLQPDMVMDQWIDTLTRRYPISLEQNGAKTIAQIGYRTPERLQVKAPELTIKNGWIVRGNQVITGTQQSTSMWRGTTKPGDMRRPTANINRFVPGRMGRGRTDELDTLAQDMVDQHVAMMRHFPALWYERRRDDHERNIRSNADVWAPFLEQPFSRSGIGEAADRMSKYDLDKFNPYYWARLKRFADLADEKGLVLWHEHYHQHNIIEEGAHWVDYPWRSLNNINNMGFVEPTRFAGDKRVYMAEEFYDIFQENRAGYHSQYIHKSVDHFDGNNGVIHCIAGEYTGPSHFMAFWLRNIDKWAKSHSQTLLVSVNGTKDVLNDMLENPETNAMFNIIDIAKWQYRADGSLYAPEGGVSLAARQYARLESPGDVSFESVYRAVYEYRTKYPDKAVVYTNSAGAPENQWAILMAGGSLARIPYIANDHFLTDVSKMQPIETGSSNGQWTLGAPGTGYIVYSVNGTADFDLTNDRGRYIVRYIDPKTGLVAGNTQRVRGGQKLSFKASDYPIIWLSAK